MIAIEDMSARAQEVFRLVVEEVMQTGAPAGSRNIAKLTSENLSAPSVRNVMADLEDWGLIHSPHTSAGRAPTSEGIRLFVDSFMEVKIPDDVARKNIEQLESQRHNLETMFASASKIVSELSQCAAIVTAPKLDRVVREIRFIPMQEREVMAMIVHDNGTLENRLFKLPNDVATTSLLSAANFLNDHMPGKTMSQAIADIKEQIKVNRREVDTLTATLVEQGLLEQNRQNEPLFVRGYGNLMDNADKDKIKVLEKLFRDLDSQETVEKVLKAAEDGRGIGIYIGQDNDLVKSEQLSLIAAPARDKDHKIVGAVAVIGPAYANFGRIVPVVDFTAKVMGRLIR